MMGLTQYPAGVFVNAGMPAELLISPTIAWLLVVAALTVSCLLLWLAIHFAGTDATVDADRVHAPQARPPGRSFHRPAWFPHHAGRHA